YSCQCFVLLSPPEVCVSEMGLHRGHVGVDSERFFVRPNRFAEVLALVVNGPDIVVIACVGAVGLGRAFVITLGLVQHGLLVIREADFIEQESIARLWVQMFLISGGGFRILLACHQDIRVQLCVFARCSGGLRSGCLGDIGLLGRSLLLRAGLLCAPRRIQRLPRKKLRCNQEDEGNRRSSCHAHGHSSQPAAEVQGRGGDSGTFASVFVLILFAASKDTKNTVKQTFFLFVFVDRKSTRLNSSHGSISYAVFCFIK